MNNIYLLPDLFRTLFLHFRYSTYSFVRMSAKSPIYFIIGQSAVNTATHNQSTILQDFLPCFFFAICNYIKHSIKDVLRPNSVNFLLHNLKIQLLIICILLALHWIICGVLAKSDVRHNRMQSTCQVPFLRLFC